MINTCENTTIRIAQQKLEDGEPVQKIISFMTAKIGGLKRSTTHILGKEQTLLEMKHFVSELSNL